MEHEISNQELFLQLRTAQEQIRVLQEKQEELPVVQTFQPQLASNPQNLTPTFNTVQQGNSLPSTSPFQFNSGTPTAENNDANIQQMLTGTLAHLINPSHQDRQGETLISNYLILGATLDPKIKAKIWAGEYVDLSSLQGTADPAVSVSVHDDGNPSISLKTSKSTPPASYFQWLRLFGIYAAVYLQKFPNQAPSMVTYMVRILEINTKHAGYLWRSYDENFRRVRAHVTEEVLPWHRINWDLLLQNMSNGPLSTPNPRNQPFRRNPNQTNQTRFDTTNRTPRGICFVYDKQGKCDRPACRFEHKCTKCWRKGHPREKCYSKVQQPQPSNLQRENKTTLQTLPKN